MTTNNIPIQEPHIPWYEKNGVAIEVEWNLLPAGLGLRRWLFDYQGAYVRQYKGYHCFWIRGWVRLLGIYVGAGCFFRGEKIDA